MPFDDPRPDLVSPQQRREHPEPHESANPVPWPVLLLVGALLVFGMVYIASSRLAAPGDWGDGRSRAELAGGGAAQPGDAGRVDGAALYAAMCAACHQAGGTGVPGAFPPLAGSARVNGADATAAAIVLRGIDGPLTASGRTYRGQMPAFRDRLDDAQIAAVLTHLRSSWGNASAPVSAATVARARSGHAAHAAPLAGDADLPPPRAD